MTMVLEGWMG